MSAPASVRVGVSATLCIRVALLTPISRDLAGLGLRDGYPGIEREVDFLAQQSGHRLARALVRNVVRLDLGGVQQHFRRACGSVPLPGDP